MLVLSDIGTIVHQLVSPIFQTFNIYCYIIVSFSSKMSGKRFLVKLTSLVITIFIAQSAEIDCFQELMYSIENHLVIRFNSRHSLNHIALRLPILSFCHFE